MHVTADKILGEVDHVLLRDCDVIGWRCHVSYGRIEDASNITTQFRQFIEIDGRHLLDPGVGVEGFMHGVELF